MPKTTAQLERLLGRCDVERVEIPVERILDASQRGMVLHHAVEQANAGIRCGRDVVVFTSRTLVTGVGTMIAAAPVHRPAANSHQVRPRSANRTRHHIDNKHSASPCVTSCRYGNT